MQSTNPPSKRHRRNIFSEFSFNQDSLFYLLPDEVLDRVFYWIFRWSTVKALRLTCKRLSRIVPCYHARQCRIRDQYQDAEAIQVTRANIEQALRCYQCGYMNKLQSTVQMRESLRTYNCSFPSCKKSLCAQPLVPSIVHLDRPGSKHTMPGRLRLKLQDEDMKFANAKFQLSWKSKYPCGMESDDESCIRWKHFTKVHSTSMWVTTGARNIRKLYSFRARFIINCTDPDQHEMAIQCENGGCLFSDWSKPTIYAHPLTQHEANELSGEVLGYFAK